jgi:hypothetical protein
VRQAEVHATAADAPAGLVELRLAFDAGIEGLQRILFDLETGAPILILRSLDLNAGNTAAGGDSADPLLHVVMQVVGHRGPAG